MKLRDVALAGLVLTVTVVGWLVWTQIDTALDDDAQRRDTAVVYDPREVEVPGPPCDHATWAPYRQINLMCNESLYDNVTPPEAAPALLGLALDDDGTLYFTRPAFGDIWAIRDADADQVTGAPVRVAAGLNLPQYVTVDGDDLLVTSVDGLLRLSPTGEDVFGEAVVLLDAVQAEAGQWPGPARIGPDTRIYIGLGASGDTPGAVISVAADGSDRRVEASGLRYPADFTWHPESGDLWVVDSRGPDAPYDALFRVPADATTAPEFGYPTCVEGTESACVEVDPPLFTFELDSGPAGLLFYTFQAWDFWRGDLLVTLSGSWNAVVPHGYRLLMVDFGDDFLPTGGAEVFMPARASNVGPSQPVELSLLGFGFYPYHLADVVIDDQGWLYIGIQEGRILRTRPRPAVG